MPWNSGNLQKLRELANKCGNLKKCSFSMTFTLHNYVTNFITFPWQQGEMAALVWSKRKIFQHSAKIYVIFLQRKCGDYEIMQAPHILHGNRQFMRWKCGIFEKNAGPYSCRLWLIMCWILRSHNRVFLEGLYIKSEGMLGCWSWKEMWT